MEDKQNLLAEVIKTNNTQVEFKESLRMCRRPNSVEVTVEQTIEDLSPQQQLDWLKSRQEMALRQQNQQTVNDLDKTKNE